MLLVICCMCCAVITFTLVCRFDELICLKSCPQLQGLETNKQAEQEKAYENQQAESQQQQLQVCTVEEASAKRAMHE